MSSVSKVSAYASILWLILLNITHNDCDNRCGIERHEPPCTFQSSLFINALPGNQVFRIGLETKLYLVHLDGFPQQQYILKIHRHDVKPDDTTLREEEITRKVHDIVHKDFDKSQQIFGSSPQSHPPSVIPLDSQGTTFKQGHGRNRTKTRLFAMLMHYYPDGDAAQIQNHPRYQDMQSQRDLFVFKFLFDASFVLMRIWSKKLIDRDVKLTNFVMTGDLRDFRKTVFVKIDYGSAVTARRAQSQLSAGNRSITDFVSIGTHVKSLDFLILYISMHSFCCMFFLLILA